MATLSLGEIRKLSIVERLDLVEAIWDSIAADQSDLPFTETQREEVRRRLNLDEQDPADARPWSEVRQRILGRA